MIGHFFLGQLLSIIFLIFLIVGHPAVAQIVSPPGTSVFLNPNPIYFGSTLYGSAQYYDPEGNAEGNSTYRWIINGIPITSEIIPQTLLLHFDNQFISTDGQPPLTAEGVSFVPGRFRQAVRFGSDSSSRLAFPATGKMNPNEGTVEFWLSSP